MPEQNNGIARGMGINALMSWLGQPSAQTQAPVNTDVNSMPNAQAPAIGQMVNPTPSLQDSMVGGSFGNMTGAAPIAGTGLASYPSNPAVAHAPTGHL